MINKSDFMNYLVSPLHFWAGKHDQLERTIPTSYQKHLMDQGLEIEKLARVFIEQVVSKNYTDPEVFWQITYIEGLYQSRADAVIYDHTTQFYDLFEIKSGTSVKKEDIFDATFQALICESKLELRNVYIIHVNKAYVHQGTIDIAKFFVVSDITEDVREIKGDVRDFRINAWHVSQLETPEGLEGCTKPADCPCPNLCHPSLPKHPIYDISRIGKKAFVLRNMGILSINEIPDHFPLSKNQKRQVHAVREGSTLIDHAAIKNQLSTLDYPLYFLDYETFNPANPLFDGYHPYQHIVFQYSLHILKLPDRRPIHTGYLATGDSDPARKLLEHLSNRIGDDGTVIVWNKTFEMNRNKELAELYPAYGDFLLDLNTRVFDLMDIFRKGYYLHPDFQGSASIKKVLPVLVPELQYSGLTISKGDEAMLAWYEMIVGDVTTKKKDQIANDLRRYCELDTLAMVEIWNKLVKVSQILS